MNETDLWHIMVRFNHKTSDCMKRQIIPQLSAQISESDIYMMSRMQESRSSKIEGILFLQSKYLFDGIVIYFIIFNWIFHKLILRFLENHGYLKHHPHPSADFF